MAILSAATLYRSIACHVGKNTLRQFVKFRMTAFAAARITCLVFCLSKWPEKLLDHQSTFSPSCDGHHTFARERVKRSPREQPSFLRRKKDATVKFSVLCVCRLRMPVPLCATLIRAVVILKMSSPPNCNNRFVGLEVRLEVLTMTWVKEPVVVVR